MSMSIGPRAHNNQLMAIVTFHFGEISFFFTHCFAFSRHHVLFTISRIDKMIFMFHSHAVSFIITTSYLFIWNHFEKYLCCRPFWLGNTHKLLLIRWNQNDINNKLTYALLNLHKWSFESKNKMLSNQSIIDKKKKNKYTRMSAWRQYGTFVMVSIAWTFYDF